MKCSEKDYDYLSNCNRLSGEVWNLCVHIGRLYYQIHGKGIGRTELQKLTSKCVNLHSKNIYHVVHKYLYAIDSMFRSKKAEHQTSKQVKLPYKYKRFFTTGWDYQSMKINYDKNIILLPKQSLRLNGKNTRQKPVKCYAKNIPKNIVEIELIYRDKLYLAIKYKEENNFKQVQSNNTSAIDLGEIHSITCIDNNGNARIITGRKMRSIKQLRNKNLGKLSSKRDRCKKYSRQWWKYNNARKKMSTKADNQILDCVHKITKLYVDYCLENDIKYVLYGDLDSCTRNTKGRVRKSTGQKLNQWNYGEIMQQLENKLSRYGIELIKVKEYYTSSTCPVCGERVKPNSRNFKCHCGYVQHRDIVGAINILNNNTEHKITKYNTYKYLRIA